MIGYTCIGTNDLPRATDFYDALFAPLNAKRAWESEGGVAWTTGANSPMFSVLKPFDKQAATVGNGVMIALSAANPAQVDELHSKAMALGGKDEGAPGPRGGGFYVGYFRDLDGNKLAAFCMAAS